MKRKHLILCIAAALLLSLITVANTYAAKEKEPDYLCFTAIEDGASVGMKTFGSNVPEISLEYKFNNDAWKKFSIETDKITLNTGDQLRFRAGGDGTNATFATSDSFNRFDIPEEGEVTVSGNIMSLLDASCKLRTVPDYGFRYLFAYCRGVVSIKDLTLPVIKVGAYSCAYMFEQCEYLVDGLKILPATILSEGCYSYMFHMCWKMYNAPILPATNLAKGCYENMFSNCGITAPPELPATTLKEGCYKGMFALSSITKAPKLPAKELTESCYEYMFNGCTELTKGPKLPATKLASHCYQEMFEYSGLTEAPELPARELAVGCYSLMFSGCESLETAPILPAETLVSECYNSMFFNDTKLKEITVYFTDWNYHPDEDLTCTDGWLMLNTSIIVHCTEELLNNTNFEDPDFSMYGLDSENYEDFELRLLADAPELPPEIDFPWWVIPFIFGGTGSGSSSSSEPSTPVTLVIPNASYDKCTKTSDCPMYVYYDLDTTKWYHDGIHFCLDNGLMNGVGSYTFDPDGTTTRPMMVTILSRMDGCDTEGGASWDEVGKAWAKTYGISDGIPEEGNITREEFATMLYRYAQKEGKGFTGAWMFLLDFKDADKVSSWASEAVHWCVMKGILQGRTGLYEGMLDPQATLTRAEASAMIQRFCEVK